MPWYFSNRSFSWARLTVIPAFLMPTPWVLSISIASFTALPLVTRRFSAVRSTSTKLMSKGVLMNMSRMRSKATCAISSPCKTTSGFSTWIFELMLSPLRVGIESRHYSRPCTANQCLPMRSATQFTFSRTNFPEYPVPAVRFYATPSARQS